MENRSTFFRVERGFTLIELMIVVLIVSILVAIAVPTFLNQRQNAQDRAAQAHLRQALADMKSYYASHEAFTADLDELEAVDPVLFKRNDVDNSLDPVIVRTSGSEIVCLSAQTPGGHWFAIYEDAQSATSYGNDGSDPLATCGATPPGGFSEEPSFGWQR